jgi:hypothetical protein
MDIGSRKWAWAAAILLGITSGVVSSFFWPLVHSGTNSTRFTAVLALLGVFFTASVSGVLTRQSNKRLKQEGVDNNRRLRLDAAMRAGSLVAPSKDLPLSPAPAASGLLALTELDHSELAVALLVDLWSKKTGVLEEQGAGPGRAVDPAEKMNASSRVSNETAVLVIDAALRSYSCPNAPLIAAELLCRNAELLDACQSLHWPSAIDGGWIPEVGPKTKLLLVDALVTMTVTSDANENALRSLAVRLYASGRVIQIRI